MNIEGKMIWAVACGENYSGRDFTKVCTDWDVILIGSGKNGPYFENKALYGKSSKFKRDGYKEFAEDIKDGHIIVLHHGMSKILGVGMVVGDYNWSKLFEDIDGWDLQHYRRVRWLPLKGVDPGSKSIALGRGRVHKIHSVEVIEWLKSLSVTDTDMKRELRELPKTEPKPVTCDEIGKYLCEKGISSTQVETLFKEFDKLIKLADWYDKNGQPSEHETVAYLVIPILRALGWTHEQMAVEWKHVDLALFDQPKRKDENLAVVVEVKKKGHACLSAQSQAEHYAQSKDHCKRLIVTDGLRYGTFLRERGENNTWIWKLYAYFNLRQLTDKYSIYECGGAKEALHIMAKDFLYE